MSRLLRRRLGAYLRSSGQLMFWMVVRAAALAVPVVVLSRLFGAGDYGKFIAVASIPAFLWPFAGLGLSGILVRDGARHPQYIDDLLASALRTWAWSTLACMVLACLVGSMLLRGEIPMPAALALIAAEVASTSLVDLLMRSQQARHHAARFGAINAGLPVARLIALLAYWLAGRHTLGGWMWTYAGSGIVYAIVLVVWLKPKMRAHADAPRLRIREGLSVGSAALVLRLQAEFNKPFLAHLGFDQAAHMGVAQRAVDFANLPLLALQETLWPRFYADGEGHAQMRKAALALVSTGLLLGAMLWFCAGLVPWLLGADFDHAVSTIRWLAWLPVVQLLRNISNFSVLAANQAGIFGVSYLIGALVAVGSTVTLVPAYGMAGALATAYMGEVGIIAIQQLLLCRRKR
ncbi:MAG: hypothetical protein QM586_13210 [Xenophilus sp.]